LALNKIAPLFAFTVEILIYFVGESSRAPDWWLA
jgi:hypothetical protein